MNNEKLLCWMQNWFHSNCNGDWEHNQNIIITTIDNPGWGITINLEGSNMEGNFLDPIKAEKDENDWYYCKADGKKFEGDGGPGNLIDILKVFKTWVENQERDFLKLN